MGNHVSSTVIVYYNLSIQKSISVKSKDKQILVNLLGGRVRDELNTLGDVTLEAIVAGLKELLLVVVDAADNVNGLLGTAGLSHSQ